MEIIKIIEGYNKEKEILITRLTDLKDYQYESTKTKAKELRERLTQVDAKIDDLVDRLIKKPVK